MKELVQVEAAMPGLYATSPQPLPFDSSLDIRAFLLRRKQGNLLVYSVNTLAADAPAVRDLGGIARRYFNHWHETMVASDRMDAQIEQKYKDVFMVIKGYRMYQQRADPLSLTIIDPKKTPRQIDGKIDSGTIRGIYQFKDDNTLIICWGYFKHGRPTAFDVSKRNCSIEVLKRAAK
jgi:uncharacterized protein (TIGR03067 family)